MDDRDLEDWNEGPWSSDVGGDRSAELRETKHRAWRDAPRPVRIAYLVVLFVVPVAAAMLFGRFAFWIAFALVTGLWSMYVYVRRG